MIRGCLLFFFLSGAANVIPVHTQAEFDAFPAALERMLPESTSIRVEFGPGTFFFRDSHLDLRGLDRPGLEIVLAGNNTRIVASGMKEPSPAFSPDDGWVDLQEDADFSLMGAVRKARSYPIPSLRYPDRFRLWCDEPDISEEDASDVYLILTQWFQGALYKVRKISKGIAYLERKGTHPTAWYTEFRFGRCLPRYRMVNHPSDRTKEDLHRCLSSSFCSLEDCRLGSFQVEGIRFLGNRAGESLFLFSNLQVDSAIISSCTFEGIRSTVVDCRASDHVRFHNNEAFQCYRGCFSSDHESVDARVEGNFFRDMGLALTNAPVVLCKGPGFWIAENRFEDFSYSAIGVGTHFKETDYPIASGIVEGNEICMTDTFRQKPMRMLIDSGAIYVWTQNVSTIIRGNYIHDISGHHGNRGIFCDDGVLGVQIEDNLVLHVLPSYCIDLRKRFKVQRIAGSRVKKANVSNRVSGNVVDGRCRLYVRKDDPESYIGNNLTLPSDTPREVAFERWKQWTGR